MEAIAYPINQIDVVNVIAELVNDETNIVQSLNTITSNQDNIIYLNNIYQININKNIKNYFRKDALFYFYLPNKNIILYVKCYYAAINAADMEIIYTIKNNIIDESTSGFFLSYNYENFDTINYTSFAYKEKCLIFIE